MQNQPNLPHFLTDPDSSIYTSDNYLTIDLEVASRYSGFPDALNKKANIELTCIEDSSGFHHKWGNEYTLGNVIRRIESVDFIVAHNAKFELSWFQRAGVDISNVLVWDTQVAEYVIAGNRKWPLDLDSVGHKYGFGGKSSVVSQMIKSGICVSDIPKDWLLEYCLKDVDITHKVFRAQLAYCIEHNLLNVVFMRCLFTPVLADIEKNGMHLDAQAVYKEYTEKYDKFQELEAKLNSMSEGINWSSGPQVAKFLYEDLKFKEIKNRWGKPLRTAAGKKSTKAEHIEQLKATTKKQKEFKKIYLERNKVKTALSKTLDFFYGVCRERDGLFNAEFNQTVTVTHRLSSNGRKQKFSMFEKEKGVQFQNFPRVYKKLFTPRDPDYLMCEIDGSQLEFRVAGILSKDPTIISDIENKIDVHSVTLSVMDDLEYDWVIDNKKDPEIDEKRNEAKPDCVPLDSLILTRQGWKTYYEVQIGEEVLTYNQKEEKNEWQPLLNKVIYDDVEVYRMYLKHNWEVRCTRNHRWYGNKRVMRQGQRTYKKDIKPFESINSEFRIQTACKKTQGGGLDITEDEASLLGWLWTDGTVRASKLSGTTSQGSDGRRQAIRGLLIQKKEPYVNKIDNLLKRLGIWGDTNRVIDDRGRVRWGLKSPWLRGIYKKAKLDLYSPDYVKFILDLTPECRKAWFEAVKYAEGNLRHPGEWRIGQNEGKLQEAIHLAGWMEGHDMRLSWYRDKRSKFNHAKMQCRTRNYVGMSRVKKEFVEKTTVWCPKTPNNTWVMKQGDTITITGNTFGPLFGKVQGTEKQTKYFDFFKKKYKILTETQEKWIDEVLNSKDKSITNITGLRFYFPNCRILKSGWIQDNTNIRNANIQSLATADIWPTAMVYMWHRMKQANMKSFIANTVHDSGIPEVHKDEVDQMKEIAKQACLQDVYFFFKQVFDIEFCLPLAVEVKIGERWGQGTTTVYEEEPEYE